LPEVIADLTHPERLAMLRWLGGSYDPEAFSAANVKFDVPKVRWRNAFSRD
jgi:hypothetical protein